MKAHDLLQISGLVDLVYVGWELLPPSPKLISSPAENGRSATPRARFLRPKLTAIRSFRDDRMIGDSPEKRCPLWVERSLKEAPFVCLSALQNVPMQVAQELITIFSGSPCRVDAQLETPRGAVSLAEYARAKRPCFCDKPVVQSVFPIRGRENSQ